MAAKKDYYELLGIPKNSSKDDIKKAYKNLAKKYHPDINKESNASEKFKEINEAASVLSDDKKRESYDRFGTADTTGSQGFNESDFSAFSEEFDLGDMFQSFFGGNSSGRKQQRSRRGSDLEYELEIILEEAVLGVKKTISVPKMHQCTVCNGTGAKSRDDVIICETCQGSGVLKRQQRTPFGIFQTSATCSSCRGVGKVIKHPCVECNGQGRVKKTKKIEITIPAGIDSGQRLRMTGEGEYGEHGTGDLYLLITVLPHDLFERDGDDLRLEAKIGFVQAALGSEIDVPTINGKVKMKIPAGTQTNTVFRIAGKGVQTLQGYGTGDLFIKIILQTPTKLTKKQKELLEEFDSFDKDSKKGLFEKIKEAF